MFADCAPSRNSFFTGRRPTVTGVHTFDKHDAREYAPLIRPRLVHDPSRRAPRPPWTALPQAFADAGYATYGAGITVESFHDSASRCPGCWSAGYFLDWPPHPSIDTFDAVVAQAAVSWLYAWRNGTIAVSPPSVGTAQGAGDGGGGGEGGGGGSVGSRPRLPFFLMAGFHAGHKPWPDDEAVHAAYGTDAYTLTHNDLRQRVSRPSNLSLNMDTPRTHVERMRAANTRTPPSATSWILCLVVARGAADRVPLALGT